MSQENNNNNNNKKQLDNEDLAQSILTESNRIRANPRSYIPLLQEQMKYFDDLILSKPDCLPVETYEGIVAYEEAIAFLKKQKPVRTLTYDERLSKASEDHANDIGSKGLFTHEGSDGRNVSERVEKYIEWEVACCENIDLGSKKGTDVIINLLVDDGVEKKPHRVHLFREEFTHIGIHVADHKDFDTVAVIDYIGGIRDKGKPFFDPKTYKYEYPKNLSIGFKTKIEEKKQIKPKTSFQLTDPDAPDNTRSVKLMKETRLYEKKVNKVTKKYYDLSDGTHYIVEVEEI